MVATFTDRPMTREAIEGRVLADARRAFAGTPEPVLAASVRRAVDALWTDDPRVTTFIPVLALREVRALLDGDDQASSAA